MTQKQKHGHFQNVNDCSNKIKYNLSRDHTIIRLSIIIMVFYPILEVSRTVEYLLFDTSEYLLPMPSKPQASIG